MVKDNKGLKKEYGRDSIHPNLEAYKVMKTLVKVATNKALLLELLSLTLVIFY